MPPQPRCLLHLRHLESRCVAPPPPGGLLSCAPQCLFNISSPFHSLGISGWRTALRCITISTRDSRCCAWSGERPWPEMAATFPLCFRPIHTSPGRPSPPARNFLLPSSPPHTPSPQPLTLAHSPHPGQQYVEHPPLGSCALESAQGTQLSRPHQA